MGNKSFFQMGVDLERESKVHDYVKDYANMVQARDAVYHKLLEDNFTKMKTPLQTTRGAMICHDSDTLIVCSAAITEHGLVIASVRHGDELFYNATEANSITFRWEQGFLTNRFSFVTRKEAWIIAERQGQIRNTLPCDDARRLYSENLY